MIRGFFKFFLVGLVIFNFTNCRGTEMDARGELIHELNPFGPAEQVSFLTFGDWGSASNSQKKVANSMKEFCLSNPCEFVLTLGDNFYNYGVQSVTDPLWTRAYKEIYDGLNLPFYATLGNHDHYGNVQAQIDFTKVDRWWNMPGKYYSIKWPKDAEIPVVEIFAIDSQTFGKDRDAQEWLRSSVGSSEATWKFLAMHHPMYNPCPGDEEPKINKLLLPVVCDNIDLVISGHCHTFAHMETEEDGCHIEQLIIGTGGLEVSPRYLDSETLISIQSFGFGWLHATREMLTFQMVNELGTIIYSTGWGFPFEIRP